MVPFIIDVSTWSDNVEIENNVYEMELTITSKFSKTRGKWKERSGTTQSLKMFSELNSKNEN